MENRRKRGEGGCKETTWEATELLWKPVQLEKNLDSHIQLAESAAWGRGEGGGEVGVQRTCLEENKMNLV